MTDSGVIFEGSPLARYLEEVGLADNYVTTSRDNVDAATSYSLPESPTCLPPQHEGFGYGGSLEVIRSLLRCHFYSPCISSWTVFKYIPTCYESGLMLLDDCHLLDSVCTVLTSPEDAVEGDSDHALVGLQVEANTSGAMSIPLAMLMWWNTLRLVSSLSFRNGDPLQTVVGFGLLWFNVKSMIDVTSIAVYQHTHSTLMSQLSRYIQVHQKLDTTLQRALRQLQEVELVARGYCVTAGFIPPISRIEKVSDERLCIAMRNQIYTRLRVCLMHMRESTTTLIQSRPLVEGLDYSALYIASSSLSNLGISAEQDPQRLSLTTEALSLSSLKNLFAVFEQQRSEWLRRVWLSVLVECEYDPLQTTDVKRTSPNASVSAHALFMGLSNTLAQQIHTAEITNKAINRQVSFHDNFIPVDDQHSDDDTTNNNTNTNTNNNNTNANTTTNQRAPSEPVGTRQKLIESYQESLGQLGRSMQTAVASTHLCLAQTDKLVSASRAAASSTSSSSASSSSSSTTPPTITMTTTATTTTTTTDPQDAMDVRALQQRFARVRDALAQACRQVESSEACLQVVVDDMEGGGPKVEPSQVVNTHTSEGLPPSSAPTITVTDHNEPVVAVKDEHFEAYTGPTEEDTDQQLTAEERKIKREVAKSKRARQRKEHETMQAMLRLEREKTASMLRELQGVLGNVR